MTFAGAPARVSQAVPRIVRCAEAEPRLFARALAWRLVLPVLKAAVPVKVLARWMDRSHRLLPASAAAARVAAVERLLADGGRLVVSSNCLERSLLAYGLLSESGAEVALVMGMRREGATVAGHAWIEHNGRPLGDATAVNYEPLVRFKPQATDKTSHG
jgi:hypothetical protein